MGQRIDRDRSRARIERDIETLGGPAYTLSEQRDLPLCVHRRSTQATLDYFTAELERIGFTVWHDPVGTLIASNVAPGAAAFGVGSHCDSNRNGGKYDGTLGVCTALEVCRLAVEAGNALPLRLISFLEEEGSGFGQMLLGSRIMLQRVTEEELRETLPRRARRVVLGVRRGRRLRARALAGVDPRARRPDRLDRGAHRAGTRPAGHWQPARDRRGDRRLHPWRPALPRQGRSRGRDADGLPPRCGRPGRRDDRRARAAGQRARGRRRRDGRRDRGAAGSDQRRAGRRPPVARPALRLGSAGRAVRPDRRLRARARRGPRRGRRVDHRARSCPCSPWTQTSSPH